MLGYVHMSAGTTGSQRKLMDPLELELQGIVNFFLDVGAGN